MVGKFLHCALRPTAQPTTTEKLWSVKNWICIFYQRKLFATDVNQTTVLPEIQVAKQRPFLEKGMLRFETLYNLGAEQWEVRMEENQEVLRPMSLLNQLPFGNFLLQTWTKRELNHFCSPFIIFHFWDWTFSTMPFICQKDIVQLFH